MVQEIVQSQEIDTLHVDPLVSDHLHCHAIDAKVRVLDYVILLEKSILTELYHVQDTLNFTSNEETVDLLTLLLPEIIAIVLFLDPTHEIDCFLESFFLHIDLHQDHVHHLRPHEEDLL